MKHTTFLAIFVMSFMASYTYATTSTVSPKATATLTSSCRLTAQNVNFGVITLPMTGNGQSASSTMNLYCTKGTSYTVSLNYGYTTTTMLNKAAGGDYYKFVNGVNVGRIGFLNPASPPDGYVYDPTGTTTNFYLSSDTGTMVGATKGDGIAYQITVPNDDANYWSGTTTGHVYTDIGTGDVQTLPIKATATTGVRGSAYPAPDSYSSTVTATVTY